MSNELSTHPSLCPPSHGYPPNQATPTSWVILDLHAYIADRENSTSAYGEMSNGKAIRVTFCTSPPPLVSYICIWCPDLPPDQLSMFPTIEAAEADLVLFHVSLSDDLGGGDYFVYKASGGKGPSLRRLDDARRYLQYQYCTALLACRDVGNGGHIRPHTGDDDGHYYLATLNYNPERPADFILRMYNSVDKTWSFSRPVSLCTNDSHFTSKVITLGECGSLGFIDAWRGILVCDMFGRKPDYYLPLPKHLVTFDKPGSDPKLFRDIALVDGRLTLVELHRRIDPASGTKLNSWDLSTWSISSPWEGQDGWRMQYTIRSDNVIVDDNAENAALVTRLLDNGGTSHRTLGQLQLAHPTLSLSDNRVVYLMGKLSIFDKKALVLSVDLESSRLQGAAVFDAERMLGIGFGYTYMHSRISGYFDGAPGTKGNLKRPGKFHMLYPRKLQAGVTMMDGVLYTSQLSGNVQGHMHPGSSDGAADNMAWSSLGN